MRNAEERSMVLYGDLHGRKLLTRMARPHPDPRKRRGNKKKQATDSPLAKSVAVSLSSRHQGRPTPIFPSNDHRHRLRASPALVHHPRHCCLSQIDRSLCLPAKAIHPPPLSHALRLPCPHPPSFSPSTHA